MPPRTIRGVLRGVLAGRRAEATVASHTARYRAPGTTTDAEGAARFYDLVTDFYEYGWGESFHFAPRVAGETLPASLTRLEHRVAERLGLRPGMRVLDAGCGIGGPMRAIARFSGAEVEGVTINDYQVRRANLLNGRHGLTDRCRAIEGDFARLPHPDRSFDAAYTFEAICHAGDRSGVLRELARVLKPGGLLAGTDWCLTANFRATDPDHQRVRAEIEAGNGLALLMDIETFRGRFAAAGLDLLEAVDLAPCQPPDISWYRPLQSGWRTATELRRTRAGRRITTGLVRLLEATRLAPKGTTATARILNRAADGLIEGGASGIFTPLFYFCARRPLDGAAAPPHGR